MAKGLKFRIKEVDGLYYLRVAKTNALISCTVTVQLISVFVFAYKESRFSYDAAHMYIDTFFFLTSITLKMLSPRPRYVLYGLSW